MKTYLSLTTSPSRLKNILTLLKNIDLVHFDNVIINIPLKFARNGSTYDIPPDLEKFPKVIINKIPKDLGPLTKIYPTLQFAQNSNDIIVSIDDDIKHDSDIFPILIEKCKTNNVVVTGIGKNLDFWESKKYGMMPRRKPFEFRPKQNYVDLIEGFSGVAYKKSFFPNLSLLKTLSKTCKECFVSDDFVISFYLKLFGRRILSLNSLELYGLSNQNKTKYSFNLYEWGLGNNALHKGGGLKNDVFNIDVNKIKYPICYKVLIQYFTSYETKINSILLQSWHHDFDSIYVINMKKKPERKKQSIDILKKLHVPAYKIKILNATTPNSILVKEFRKIGFEGTNISNFLGNSRSKSNKQTIIEAAVAISQLRVMKNALNKNETVLMLEDDFGPTKHFYDVNAHKLHRQYDWHTLYLGDCKSMRSGTEKVLVKGDNNKLIARHTVCHHSLAFKPLLSQQIFKNKPIIPLEYPIDNQLSYYMNKHDIPFAIYDNPLMIQDVKLGTKSNIQSSAKLKWEVAESNKFGNLNLRKI